MALVPSLFTFIDAAYSAGRASNAKLSDWHESAGSIETAVFVGSGASFSVRRQRTNFRPQTFHANLDGLELTYSQPTNKRPRYIAYKTVNVRFKPTGVPVDADGPALLNALQELLAITHGPILQHPNIVDFLGLAWNDVPDTDQKAPVLAVEYAEYGSLAALQKSRKLEVEDKRQLAIDIGFGLEALHRCGIVHGDIKPDNVLVFDGESRGRPYVAKLADFGFALLGNDWPPSLSGTFLWSAPEITSRQVLQPKSTDIFSYGLTVWSIYLDGLSPVHTAASAKSRKLTPSIISALKVSGELLDYAKAQDQDFADAQRFLDVTLALDPHDRSLSTAIDLLGGNQVRPEVDIPFTPLAETRAYQTFRNSLGHEFPISWNVAGQLGQGVQKFLTQSLQAMASDVPGPNMIKPTLLFGVAAMQCNGIGVTQDFPAAIANIIKIARYADHKGCQSIAYRVCRTFDGMSALEAVGESRYLEWLEYNASRGSWAAQEDLEYLSPTRHEKALTLLKVRYCGVGANFFDEGQFVDEWKYDEFLDLSKFLQTLKKRHGSISSDKVLAIKINRRGDGLLHVAASCGLLPLLKWLVGLFPQLINQLNPLGESPLFHACRAGQLEAVRFLLSKEADASLETPDGVGPIHWLVNFDDELVPQLLTTLKKNDGNLEACALRPLDYVCYGMEVKFAYGEVFCRGTPMHWAVCKNRPKLMKELIAQGALFHPSMFPKGSKTKEKDVPPNYLAAMLHHYECLEVLIDEFNKWRAGFTFGPLFCQAIAGASLFSRVIAHGPDHEIFLRKTLEYLTAGSTRGHFFGGPDGQGNTLLTLAIREGFEHVGVMLLDFPRWRAEINKPGGSRAMTPFHLAAHRNMTRLMPLLIAYGADLIAPGHRLSNIGERVWFGLHYFAAAGHPPTSAILPLLVDACPESNPGVESPLTVAIDSNNFALATHLLSLPSPPSLNALINSGAEGHYVFQAPTTILGRIIKTNTHNSVPRLKFLFNHHKNGHLDFIVTPSLKFTALHEAARLNVGTKVHNTINDENITYTQLDPQDIDMLSHREIWLTLLQRYRTPEELNAQVEFSGDTALHWAVMAANDVGVEALLEAGASAEIRNREGFTPASLARRMVENWTEKKEEVVWRRMGEIMEMFEEEEE